MQQYISRVHRKRRLNERQEARFVKRKAAYGREIGSEIGVVARARGVGRGRGEAECLENTRSTSAIIITLVTLAYSIQSIRADGDEATAGGDYYPIELVRSERDVVRSSYDILSLLTDGTRRDKKRLGRTEPREPLTLLPRRAPRAREGGRGTRRRTQPRE